MDKQKIGIIGHGYVGKAMYEFFKDHYDILINDPCLEESASLEEISECNLAVVCVPTPMSKDGSCDTSIVEQVVSELETDLIIIKSTVSVGTTDKLVVDYKKRIVFYSLVNYPASIQCCFFLLIGDMH